MGFAEKSESIIGARCEVPEVQGLSELGHIVTQCHSITVQMYRIDITSNRT